MNRASIVYKTASGFEPYSEFVNNLTDRRGALRIKDRVKRAEFGNLGDYRSAGHGVVELRIDFGPGYRVYVGLSGNELIILLCAGDKKSQEADILRAAAYWADHRRRKPC